MARRRKEKEKITDPFERARLKKLRAAQRREERKKRRAESGDSGEPRRRKSEAAPDYSTSLIKDNWLWVRRSLAKSYAMRIINDHRDRPYWLSIPRPRGPTVTDRSVPVCNYFPCSSFSSKSRVFFGFLFREHRDLFFSQLENARKETTERVRAINPNVV